MLTARVSAYPYDGVLRGGTDGFMDGAELFLACLGQATLVVKQVLPEHYANATPDTEWTVHDLIGHMFYELSWVPDILEGKTIAEVGSKYDGDLIGDDDQVSGLAVRWQDEVDRAETAVSEADPDETAHLSFGDLTNDDYLAQAGTDQLIHAWDLGKAIGVTVTFDKALAAQAYEQLVPQQQILRDSGLFGEAIAVAQDADVQTKLLGLTGRDAAWRA
jgi:uncharacterized protein (TIGR03086 family)